jgi:preprotein translocase subunit SecA
MRAEVVDNLVDSFIPPQSVPEQWDVSGLEDAIETQFGSKIPVKQWLDEDTQLYEDKLKEKITAELVAEYEQKCMLVGDKMRLFEKQIVLQILDNLWKEHLATMDQLRQGIFLRSYSGKNPKQEYKREAFALFQDLLTNLQEEVIKVLSHVKVKQQDDAEAIERQRAEERARERMQFQHATATSSLSQEANAEGDSAPAQQEKSNEPFVRVAAKVGRNEPCPCGSGKKYKACHGRIG